MDTAQHVCRKFKFTKRAIEGLPKHPADSSAREQEYSDTEVVGLRVFVSKNGRMFFGHRYFYNRRKRMVRIGEFPAVPLEEARQRVNEFKNMLSKGLDPMVERDRGRSSVTFEEFSRKEYLPFSKVNKRSYSDDLHKVNNEFVPLFGKLTLASISTRDIQRMHTRIKTEKSPSTANRHLSLIARMLNLAVQWGYLEKNPCKGIKKYRENNSVERFLSKDELSRFLGALDKQDNRIAANALKLLLFTGMRRSEVLKLRWSAVDLEAATIKLAMEMTKGGKSRTVVLNSLAREVLTEMQAYKSGGKDDYVFPGRTGPVVEPTRLFRKVKEEAGIEKLRIHDLRHSYASIAINAGASLYDVQKLLGHASSQMTQRYAHLADERLRKATDSVAEEIQQSANPTS